MIRASRELGWSPAEWKSLGYSELRYFWNSFIEVLEEDAAAMEKTKAKQNSKSKLPIGRRPRN